MTDPKRLGEAGSEAPDALRALLRGGREDLPSSERLQRLATRLGPLLGGAALPTPEPLPQVPPAAGAAAGAAGTSVLIKLIGAGSAIAVLVGGASLLTRTAPPPAVPSAPVEQRQAPSLTPPASLSQPTVQPSEAQPDPAPAPAAPRPATSARSVAGPSESALLAQAQAALSTNPARALALTREHKRRFPNGALAQEREVIAIEALKRSGDAEAARKRANDFEDRYPGSAHRRKVEDETKR